MSLGSNLMLGVGRLYLEPISSMSLYLPRHGPKLVDGGTPAHLLVRGPFLVGSKARRVLFWRVFIINHFIVLIDDF